MSIRDARKAVRKGWAVKKLREMETCKKTKKSLSVILASIQQQCWPQR